MMDEIKEEYLLFGWYYSDGEHRGDITTYEFETVGWKEVFPLYKKVKIPDIKTQSTSKKEG